MFDKVLEKVSERERKFPKLFIEYPRYTRKVLSEKMEVCLKTMGEYLKALKEKRIIERAGSDWGDYWKVNL